MSLYNFKCPKCNHSHNPDDYGLWAYWDYDDDEFDFNCENCGETMTIKVKVDIEYEVCD